MRTRILTFVLVCCLMLGAVAVNLSEIVFVSADGGMSMVVIEASTNRILNESNAYARKYMASTTKIVTAITVIENVPDLCAVVTVPKEAVGVEGSSIYLELGEKITVLDLLYGLMLQSGNDAATALALHTGQSIAGFATMMNRTALKAGAKNSNFVNPHGLHDDEHYTTAYDLALISSYAMRNEAFRTIVGTQVHKAFSAAKGYERVLHNKNRILKMSPGGTGIKTGFTRRAGRCLVASSKRGDMEVIAVVLNCGPMFEECCRLINQAFATYHMHEVLGAYQYAGTVAVRDGRQALTRAYSCLPRFYPLRESEVSSVVRMVEFDDNLSAPIRRNQKIGKIKIYLHNRLLFEEKLYSIDSIDSIKLSDRLRDIIENF